MVVSEDVLEGSGPEPDIRSMEQGVENVVLAEINFLHSSWYGAMVWIRAGNSVDHTGMVLLLLSSAYTQPRPFLLLTPPHQ